MALDAKTIKKICDNFATGRIGRQHLESYVKNGRITNWEEFKDGPAQLVALLKEIVGDRPDAAERAEWAAIAPQIAHPGEHLRLPLQAYIERWGQTLPRDNQVEEARRLLADLDRQAEQADWEKVNPHSVSSLTDYLERYPNTAHIDDIDEALWGIFTSDEYTSNARSGLDDYKTLLPEGRHAKECDERLGALDAWEQIRDAGQLKPLYEYIRRHPDSPYVEEARLLMDERKRDEIETMKREFNEYDRNNLFFFVKEGIFSTDELLAEGVVSDVSLGILKDYERIKEALPDIDNVIAKCDHVCYEQHTDIYMFGIPGTGKSCILAGMVSAPSSNLTYNSVRSGGRYADALAQYTLKGFPPPPTRINYLTTIEASLSDHKGAKHPINLVEMAGEEFAFHIADNEENLVTFEDMGTGLTELLTNKNRKAFYIVVDPTKSDIHFKKVVLAMGESGEIENQLIDVPVNQQQCLKRMIDMFALPENAEIMQNVDAIHFVVTKADMLDCPPEQRDECAKQIIKRDYSNVVRSLTEVCRHYGINSNTDGRPKLYTFSLGKFYVGNIVGFDPTDSLKMIQSVTNNTEFVKKKSKWGKFLSIFD